MARKTSSFSHFMIEAERVIQFKDELEATMLSCNFNEIDSRLLVLRKCKTMLNDQVSEIFTKDDIAGLKKCVAVMDFYNDEILRMNSWNMDERKKTPAIATSVKIFENGAYQFLNLYAKAQFGAKLGFQTVKERGEIDKLFNSLDVGKSFKNSFGVTISPEMFLFALGLSMRTVKKWDNVVEIEAVPGTGKTTFDYALSTTMVDIYDKFYGIKASFTIDNNVLVAETREYCNKLVATTQPFTILMFIEAGNQFGAKRTWEDSQQDLINTIERIRFHGLSMMLEWNTIEGLDKTIRDRRATAVVTLEERGKAIVRTFNRNPGNRGLTKNPRTKNALALTAEDAGNILEVDALRLLTIPVYELPHEIQAQLDEKKEQATKYISAKRLRDRFYAEFLASLPDNIVRITSDALNRFSVEKHQVLSMSRLAQMIAENIGLGRSSRLLQQTDITDRNTGYIDVNEIMQSYIRKVRAAYQGSLEALAREGGDESAA